MVDENGIQPEDILTLMRLSIRDGPYISTKDGYLSGMVGDLFYSRGTANGLLLLKQSAQMAIRYYHA